MFYCKGPKYSVYKEVDAQSDLKFVIQSQDIDKDGEFVTITQICQEGKVSATSVVELKRLDDMRKSYGFINSIPDFAGYINYM